MQQIPLTNHNYNFWQLTCILSSALGLPGMIIGGQLAKAYGAGTAITSICIGNFILWLIGIGILSITENKNHAIENVKDYLGKTASLVAAFIWISAFLIRYALQIDGATQGMGTIFPNIPVWQMGLLFGSFVAFLGIGGIRYIKNICVVAFPLLLTFAIYATITSSQTIPFRNTWNFSGAGILSIVLIFLPGIVNIPTFYRHSRSRADSILALSLMILAHSFFQMFPIFLNISTPAEFFTAEIANATIVSLFVLLAFIVINLINIYFASVCWQAIVHEKQKLRQYFGIGLVGTFSFILFKFCSFDLRLSLESLGEAPFIFTAILAIVLLIQFLTNTIVVHRPRSSAKLWSNFCWLAGCLAAITTEITSSPDLSTSFVIGLSTSTLCFLFVIFIEETLWSIQEKLKKHHS